MVAKSSSDIFATLSKIDTQRLTAGFALMARSVQGLPTAMLSFSAAIERAKEAESAALRMVGYDQETIGRTWDQCLEWAVSSRHDRPLELFAHIRARVMRGERVQDATEWVGKAVATGHPVALVAEAEHVWQMMEGT